MVLQTSSTSAICIVPIVTGGKTRRNELDELSPGDWKKIIKQTFKKHHVYVVTLVGRRADDASRYHKGFL